jgi:hypothetical protein
MTMYYTLVISGENIFFENYDSLEPTIGFIAFRLVRAQTEELAVAIAKRDILVHWNQSFNADRKLGLPILHLEHIALFKGLIKPTIKHDYYWFSHAEKKQEHIEKLTKPKSPWFWRH